jgi:hypothetical protein
MNTALPAWVTIMSALLTPTVAGIAVYIAWRQWKLADRRIRMELFDKRFAVYSGARELIRAAVQKGDVTNDDLRDFSLRTIDASLLFSDKEVEIFLDQLHKNAAQIHVHYVRSTDHSDNARRETSIQKHTQLMKWFLDEHKRMPKVFSKDLALY